MLVENICCKNRFVLVKVLMLVLLVFFITAVIVLQMM